MKITNAPDPESRYLGRPLIFFASGFVIVEAFGNVGSDGRIVGVCDRCAVLLLDFFPSAFTGKSSGFSGF